MFRKIFIANRGEVVERIISTAKDHGIQTVVACSTADRKAPYMARTESVCIGPAASSASYLDAAAIVQAARQSHCAALHPGWGFLSEKPMFAALCEAHGITFIGPSPDVMDLMGTKTPAKRRMAELGIAGVPGSEGPVEGLEEIRQEARAIGFPIILKAESGGGGRGMRVCQSEDELESAMAEASREAAAAFSDPSLYVEKYIAAGRHIEVQVLVDRWGRSVTLGERECSVQRKHQKLIEESPSPALSDKQRCELEARVGKAVSALGYRGAGTVEFLLDGEDIYFIEMNTRLQVEHPVTEMITGVDLVFQQLLIASGERLDAKLGERRHGHAIECRINAEDPAKNFEPSPGTITRLVLPEGDGVRVDTHIEEGYAIPPFYDSLIAKLIVHGENREAAIEGMLKALDEFVIEGVKTTIGFHKTLLQSEAFRSGNYDTTLVKQILDS